MRSLLGKYILTFTKKIPPFWGKNHVIFKHKFVLFFNNILLNLKANS